MTVPNVASNAPATSAWANQVADDVNGLLPTAVAPSTQAMGDVAAAGTADEAARRDHKHGLPAFGAAAADTTFGSAATDGVATTPARSDHRHGNPAMPYAAPTAQTTYGASSGAGVSTSVPRADHTHGTPALPTAAAIGAPLAYDTPATADGGKRIYVGTSAPTGMSAGDIWIKAP